MKIELTQKGMDALLKKLTRIEKGLKSPGTVKRDVGRLLLKQHRRRIETEKTSPDGRPWMPWTKEYAATRGAGHSLLIDTGGLLESIKARVTADGINVTSDKTYAGFVNRSRQFLGISKKNSAELSDLVQKWMGRL